MAATVNDRDIFIMGGTRTVAVVLPDDISLSGDVIGTLNGIPVQDVIDAAYAGGSGDFTVEILENSGTTVTVSSSVLFEMLGAGSGGTFIGGGGIFGKNSAGVTKFSLSSSTGLLTAEDAIISGNITVASGSVDPAVTVSGNPFSTITSNASNGATAFSDTIDFRVPGAPTNSPVIGAITASAAAVGTVDIKLTWTYTQGAIKADHFILYVLEGTTNPTTSSPVLATVTGDSRDLTISGVPMDKSYRVGIVAARNSAFGVQKTAIVNSWIRTAQTANITANIDGTAPSGVKNAGITLSSSGALLGAGGGSITALDYGNVSGTKPPANATSNIFTTSASDPSGGNNGDAHWNSSTSTMWFKTAGVWRVGGTINAGQITVGTLAAARIAANSITSDKISVSTLSSIAANLGTVSAGSITGTAGIDITGTAIFKGSSGVNVAAVEANPGGTSNRSGVFGLGSGAGRAGVIGAGSSSAYGGWFTSSSSSVPALRAIGNLPSTYGLEVYGYMTITSTALVTNLNADRVDGFHGLAFPSTITADSGSATTSTGIMRILTSGISGVASAGSGNTITIQATSDLRLKKDVQDEQLGLNFIKKLKPVTYRWRDKSMSRIKYHGFIYQDMLGLENFDKDDSLCRVLENGNGSVDYISLIAPIVNAIKQLTQKIEKLENERKTNP